MNGVSLYIDGIQYVACWVVCWAELGVWENTADRVQQRADPWMKRAFSPCLITCQFPDCLLGTYALTLVLFIIQAVRKAVLESRVNLAFSIGVSSTGGKNVWQ